MREIYLDSNATTRPADVVVRAMDEALRRHWANPSSVHRAGQAVRHEVELAREEVARLLGCRDREIVFTSGGTEADNLALLGSLAARPRRRVLVTNRLEHSAVRETAEKLEAAGTEVVWLEVDGLGVVRLDVLADVLARRADEIAVVSVMWANNETGVIQPVEAIATMCREHGVRFHTDAVQWVGKMPLRLGESPIDLLSLSAHKFHGPKGSGALFVRAGVRLDSRAIGGPQERGRRGGTENVPGILGLGAAAAHARVWLETAERERLEAVRDDFERRIVAAIDEAAVNGAASPRMWNTSNIGFRRLEAEAILLLLSERGICATAGAACSSGSLDPSPVLLAMGIAADYAHGSVRFSLSRDTTRSEIDAAIEIIQEVVARLRASMSVA